MESKPFLFNPAFQQPVLSAALWKSLPQDCHFIFGTSIQINKNRTKVLKLIHNCPLLFYLFFSDPASHHLYTQTPPTFPF